MQIKYELMDDYPNEYYYEGIKRMTKLYELGSGATNIEEPAIDYKFNEDALIKQFKSYIDSTYGKHYAQEKIQATEFIIDSGHGDGFCLGNVLKYAKRYGKKGTPKDAKDDLMKVLHYALIQLYIHETRNSQ